MAAAHGKNATHDAPPLGHRLSESAALSLPTVINASRNIRAWLAALHPEERHALLTSSYLMHTRRALTDLFSSLHGAGFDLAPPELPATPPAHWGLTDSGPDYDDGGSS